MSVALIHISTVGIQCTTPTYEGSGEVVHPDVWDAGAGGWHGWRYWMAMTPYPLGNSVYENPSILVSSDSVTWQVPAGLTNPIDPWPGGQGFNSDADLLHDPNDDKLYCFYRNGGVEVRWSADGVTWSDEINTGLASVNASPAVIWDGSMYVMWYETNNFYVGWLLRRTSNSPTSGWSEGVGCTLSYTPAGKMIWHQDIVQDGSNFVGLFTFCDARSTGANAVNYLATSSDGLAWTVAASPIIPVPTVGWDNGQHYRGTLSKVRDGMYNVWYSACNATNHWHVGLLRNVPVSFV